MTYYYAHSVYKYNTPIEQYELSLIPGKVINPNGIVDQTKSEKEIMKHCYSLIDKCNALVFSSVDGVIGRGVAGEITHAFIRNKDVYYIHGNRLHKIKSIVIKPIESSNNCRIYATFEYGVTE